jgi:two-component system phosphate regulon response regulator PhoB
MVPKNILVVEDEESILELVKFHLAREGYRVSCAGTGEDGLKEARSKRPDLVVLDLMLPGLDGLEVCKALKKDARTERILVVMLTAKGEESDIVAGLELGADDYVTKPFSPKVLVARIRAVFRRREAGSDAESASVKVHNIVIHPGRHEVLVAGKPVELTHTEFRILHFLARRPGWVFTRSQILDAARGDDIAVTDRSVDVHVVSLRRKLGKHGECVQTVRGVGYRFRE